MAIVTHYLLALLNENIEKHTVVLWFDDKKEYSAFAATLNQQPSLLLPGTSFHAYDRQQGFFALRRDLEPRWRAPECPRLLIYVPLSHEESKNALVEYSKTGQMLGPHQSGEHNTRLPNLARQALRSALPAAVLEKLLADVESGTLNLADIEKMAERNQVSALGMIFESANAAEIILRFVSDPALDPALAEKHAGPQLAELLHQELDVDLGAGEELAPLRIALTRHLLTVDLILSLAESLPPALQTIPLPGSLAARESAQSITRTWRARRDLTESYVRAAKRLESELPLGSQGFTLAALRASHTLPRLEALLQTHVERALLEKPEPLLLALIQERLSGFWAQQTPESKLRWQVLLAAAQVLLHAQALRQALKPDQSASALFKRYTSGEQPWCLLDSWQRHLERDAHNYDADDSTLKLVFAAQRAYAEITHLLATRFVHAYESAGLTLEGVLQQAEIYHNFVEPAASAAPTAYFLVDAFRFEMAQELLAQLPEDWHAALTPALATPPTITEVGMAALMPQAERGLILKPAGPGKLAVTIGDATLKNRADRVKWLRTHAVLPVAVTKLNEIAPLTDKNLRNELKNARLIIVTATEEIDGIWENQPDQARRLHGDVFEQLRRGMRTLFNLGCSKIIIAADHGFLMGSNLTVGEALDAPGGQTDDLHRRVWVGKGGAAIEACLRKPLSAFGLSGDLELVTPYGLSVFKAAGGSEYFHGGLSLQEMTIPVVTVTPGKVIIPLDKPTFTWNIKPGSQKITTRFFTVTIDAESTDLFAAPPRLRAELRVKGESIATPVAASYDFDEVTREVLMKFDEATPGKLLTNVITLQITDAPANDSATLYLLDEFGASLYEISIPLAIAF